MNWPHTANIAQFSAATSNCCFNCPFGQYTHIDNNQVSLNEWKKNANYYQFQFSLSWIFLNLIYVVAKGRQQSWVLLNIMCDVDLSCKYTNDEIKTLPHNLSLTESLVSILMNADIWIQSPCQSCTLKVFLLKYTQD